MSSSSFYGGNDTDPDGYTVCPYNPLHLILNKKIAYHIAKCRKSFLHVQMATCPYNAKHVYPRLEHQYHITHCHDRAIIDREIMYGQSGESDFNMNFKGNCALPSYECQYESEENWDEDPVQSFGSYGQTASSSCQVRLPKGEPIVLEAESQADIRRRLDERKKQRQVNAPDAFLKSSSPVAADGTDDVDDARVKICNGINGNSYANDRTTSGNAEELTARPDAPSPSFAGFGRGVPLQPVLAPVVSPSTAAVAAPVGRGRAMLLQQERRVTVTPAFSLPGVGRGCVSRPGAGK